MSGNAKRNIVVATMAVLVCAAVGLNWKYWVYRKFGGFLFGK